MTKQNTTNGKHMYRHFTHRAERLAGRLRLRHIVLAAMLVAVTAFRTIPGFGYKYTTCIYSHIAKIMSINSGQFAFAIGDLFIAASVVWIVLYPIYSTVCKKRRISASLLRVGEFLLWVYVWFYAAWGINYSQPNIFVRMGMKPVKVSDGKFRNFALCYADSLNSTYKECEGRIPHAYSTADDRQNEVAIYEYRQKAITQIQYGYRQLNDSMGINRPFTRYARPKTMVFSRLASAAGVTGSMGPFFSEFTINADVLPHDYPATCAHEYAHFLGIANEGEANFYSYVVCTSSADPALRFSGYYSILFHMLANVRDILGEKEYAKYLARIRPEIVSLARRDRQYWLSRHSRMIDSTQNFFYNLYLKGNNVEGGMKSYSGVVAIIMAWEARR